MDKILKEIDESFADQINAAQEAINVAQFELANLTAVREEKKKSVTEYYTALEDKERAEAVIARTDDTIKSEAQKVIK